MYVPLGLYIRPMGLVCPFGTHLCPLGIKYTPPFKRTRPLLCMRALGSFKPLEAHICPLGAHSCPLGLFYIPWGSSTRPPLKRARPPYACASPPGVQASPSQACTPLLLGVHAPPKRARPSQACTPPPRHAHPPFPSMHAPSPHACAPCLQP
jgi:hypothetical protein